MWLFLEVWGGLFVLNFQVGVVLVCGLYYFRRMPSRGRHQSSSKECLRVIAKIEGLGGVRGVIIGRSYGGKSLGREGRTGKVRVQRVVSGGLKAVTQSSKGLQELFVRTDEGCEERVWREIEGLGNPKFPKLVLPKKEKK